MYRNLSIKSIKENNAFSIRKNNEDREISYLEQSINNYGLLCPVIVRETSDGYQLVAGKRRLQACKNLGYKKIPAIVKKMTLEEAIEISLQENIQRESLSAIEEAEAIAILLKTRGLKPEPVNYEIFCEDLGLSLNEVHLGSRLNELEDTIKAAISEKKITERQALSLTRINDEDLRLEAFNKLVSRYHTAGETEEFISELLEENINNL